VYCVPGIFEKKRGGKRIFLQEKNNNKRKKNNKKIRLFFKKFGKEIFFFAHIKTLFHHEINIEIT